MAAPLGPLLALAAAAIAWLRPDPLQPIRLVEEIIFEAFDLDPLLGVASVLAALALPTAALKRSRVLPPALPAGGGLVLATYFAATILVTFVGHFPTPVLGFGASPIIGSVLGLALVWGSAAPDARAPFETSYPTHAGVHLIRDRRVPLQSRTPARTDDTRRRIAELSRAR